MTIKRLYDNRPSRYVDEVGSRGEAVDVIRKDIRQHKSKHGAGYIVFGRYYGIEFMLNESEACNL